MIFYVYEHRRLSDGVCFYVGKGSGPRAWKTCSRNKKWKSIVKKHGFSVCLIYEGISEQDAFLIEEKLISAYGDTLCNMTAGGEGLTGRNPEVIKRLSEAQKKNWQDPEYRRRMLEKRVGSKVSDETRKKMSLSHLGKVRTPEHCANLSAALTGIPRKRRNNNGPRQIREVTNGNGDLRSL